MHSPRVGAEKKRSGKGKEDTSDTKDTRLTSHTTSDRPGQKIHRLITFIPDVCRPRPLTCALLFPSLLLLLLSAPAFSVSVCRFRLVVARSV